MYEAYRTKEYGFLLVLYRNTQNDPFHLFLLDLWKHGIKDYDRFSGNLKELKTQLDMEQLTFHRIDQNEVRSLVSRGFRITEKLQQDLPAEVLMQLNILKIFTEDNDTPLFLCFNCDLNYLEPAIENQIIQIALKEIQSNNLTIADEEQYFFVCQTCENKVVR